MDNAVSLVQAYLRFNGYFTVSEFPVIEAKRSGDYRTTTDLDILAVRFPHARLGPTGQRDPKGSKDRFPWLDPALAVPATEPDMIIGEVKEGRAVLNDAAADPAVLQAVLVRFGCCSPAEASELASRILQTGQAPPDWPPRSACGFRCAARRRRSPSPSRHPAGARSGIPAVPDRATLGGTAPHRL